MPPNGGFFVCVIYVMLYVIGHTTSVPSRWCCETHHRSSRWVENDSYHPYGFTWGYPSCVHHGGYGPCPLTRAFFVCVIYVINMNITVHASVSKITDGRTATWRFVEMDGTFAAIGDNRKIIACRDIAHMRTVYKRFTGPKYGFTPNNALVAS